MTKQDHIDYWVTTADKDWKAIKRMVEVKTYVHALFFMHLVLEKLIKAHWVKDNEGNNPPRTHNLILLMHKTRLALTEEEMNLLTVMNQFQLEGRYPDYIQGIYKTYKSKQTKEILDKVSKLRKCLLKKLR